MRLLTIWVIEVLIVETTLILKAVKKSLQKEEKTL
jgi:hypothetical protein